MTPSPTRPVPIGPPPTRPALLLAAHGTRDEAGVAAFTALAERVGDLAGRDGTRVAGGFIELSRPPLREAVAALASASAAPANLVAVPLMLSAAGHAKGDIPAALTRERTRHPGLRWTYARPLGPHPALIELLAARIAAASGSGPAPASSAPASSAPASPAPAGPAPASSAPASSAPAGPAPASSAPASSAPASTAPAVLVVGRGSTDPDANADVVKTTRLLWEGRDYPLAETAFVSLARPGVAEGLERCRLLGARQIVVARYFLFPGVLPDRVAACAGEYAAAHPELDIRCAGVLGDCDEIATLVYERYHEALSGDIRMNCDMCVYRIAMPGFEHRVGEPQHPHDHPHDPAHSGAHAHG
jgi:sirohydrochlorin cobaltochelatase